MKASILAIGSELLGTQRLDTNSLRLTAALERFGVELLGKSVVGDDEGTIVAEIRRWVGAVDLVLVGGGLGPTADDLTRPAVARALGRRMAIDEGLVAELRERFARFGRPMPEVNRRQAEVIEGATVLANPLGSAPGQRLDDGGTTIFLLPGVPRELDGLIDTELVPWLEARCAGDATVERRLFKVACLPESEVEQRLAPVYDRFGREAVAMLASPGEITVHLRATGSPGERAARLDPLAAHVREVLDRIIFTDDPAAGLEDVVARLLFDAGRNLTTAESCTGGLVAERLTRVAGSSGFFLGGVVAYSNELKTRLLGVSEADLAAHGAVSEPVARSMAEGVRERYGSDYGIGITGVAGPGGGTSEKPVGTVHVAVAGPETTRHRVIRYPGDRRQVRAFSAQLGLEMLRRMLRKAAAQSLEPA